MAKVQNNIFVRGLSGSLGEQFVVRKGRGGTTVISNKPSFSPDRQFNEAQLAHQDAFKQAIAYARSAKTEELYINKAQGTTMSAFNAAVADWFNKPRVLEIDTTLWNGEAGQVIRVKAIDDTLVTGVQVTISDPDGNVLEQGEAALEDGLWWSYTTQTSAPIESAPQVKASARDFAGNSAEMAWMN